MKYIVTYEILTAGGNLITKSIVCNGLNNLIDLEVHLANKGYSIINIVEEV